MTRFILNQQTISTDLPPGLPLLDFVRYQQHLKGTKIGCREGDCGACTVLLGKLENGEMKYQSVTSCLVPLGNAAGKHVVTVEGLNVAELSPVQQAIIEENGTQCGFCTVGFVVSLTGYCLQNEKPEYQKAIAAMDGNICRCTGYKSLERAAAKLVEGLTERPAKEHFQWLANNNYLPAYFPAIKEKLLALNLPEDGKLDTAESFTIAGGTDMLVQKMETIRSASVNLLWNQDHLKGIAQEGNKIVIGGGSTVSELRDSALMQNHFPQLYRHLKLVSSTQIRNMGTLAGNFANASPIGDLTIYFLALNATLLLKKGETRRELPLKELYLGYKTLAKQPDELIEKVMFEIPGPNSYFNFEKVSKRTHLDIASVNSAMQLKVENNRITEAFASAGGVGPVPLFLSKTAEFLKGKEISEEVLQAATEVALQEISPISDARGTAQYKRLLLRQLLFAHFIAIFPETIKTAVLL
jgi:xanthine dehydrogenase small subunit